MRNPPGDVMGNQVGHNDLCLRDSALESSNAPVLIAELNGRVQYANPAFARLWDFHGPEQIVGRDLKELFSPAEAAETLLASLREHGVWTGDLSGVQVNGTQLSVACTASLVRGHQGDPTHLVAWFADLTARMYALSDLRLKTQAIEAARAPILMTDPAGRITYANGAFCELVGARWPDDLLGRTPLDFASPSEADQHGLSEALERGAWRRTASLRRSDGAVVPVEVDGSVVRDEAGTPVCYLAWITDLTERKKAETALRLKDMALASSLAAIALVGLDGKITYANAAFAKMFGVDDPSEYVGVSPSEYNEPPEAVDAIMRELQEVGSWSGDLFARRKDGAVFPLHLSVSMVRDEHGEPLCFVAWHTDLTESRAYEEQLRASRDEYRSLATNIPGMIYRAGADWTAKLISKSQELTGYDEGQLTSGEIVWSSLVSPEDVPRMMAEAAPLLEKPCQVAQEYRIVRKGGSIRWVRDCKTSRFDSAGQFQGVDGIVLDVTDRKLAEEQLQTFRELMDQTHDAIFVIDPKTARFLDVNRKACTNLLRTREELLQMTVQDIQATIPNAGAWAAQVAYLADKGARITEGIHKRKDGTTFPVEVNASLLRVGSEDYVVAVARDITERKRAEQALRESQAEIQEKAQLLRETTAQLIQTEKLSALGELAAGVAHEMNQPLNGIKLICQDLLGDIRKDRLRPEDLKPNLDDVVALVNRLASIIDQMRLFVRRPDVTSAESCDVNEAVEGVFKMVGQQLRDQGFEVQAELEPGLTAAAIDLVKLEQVIMNLITNARDAVLPFREEDRRIVVRTRTQATAPLLIVEVQDNGQGMAAGLEQKVFEPFFTTKRPGAGTGLGLSIARRIVSDCGGHLEVESAEGMGALFRVILPVTSVVPAKQS